MLSNPTNLRAHRQHRRQQSTPTAYQPTKVPNLPTIQRNASHRRGMSLDQRRQQQHQQQELRVSITNQGYNDNQQHILRETQQQRLARQGQRQPIHYFNQTNDENLMISPIVTPQRQEFENACMDMNEGSREASPYSQYIDQFNFGNRVSRDGCAGSSQFLGDDSQLFQNGGNMTPSTFLDFSMLDPMPNEDWNRTIKPLSRTSSGRRISENIADRVQRFEEIATAGQCSSRPITPPTQDSSSEHALQHQQIHANSGQIDYFPPTPSGTPHRRTDRGEAQYPTMSKDFDESMEGTIKPIARRNHVQQMSNFQQMREQAEMTHPPSPPNTNPMPSSSTFESRAKMPKTSKFVASPVNSSYESPYQTPHDSHSSRHSSPESSQRSFYSDSDYPPQQSSPMQRSLSMDSLNLEDTIQDTGITIDDIAHYITGPDPVDQKWVCLFPECNKRFGRKENIKSHVQTHLGDRQFQCPHCRKCFVRQHDLKRHAKIHSGVKPYPCACGNSFARHDALTRHRQRGMCVGAFEGVVKKVVKRGRPRKNARPDDEERLDKATRTREKNAKKEAASQSSSESHFSGSDYSESNYGMSPSDTYHDVLDAAPFINFAEPAADFKQQLPPLDAESAQAFVPVVQEKSFDNCVSPQAIQNAPSPAYSAHAMQSQHSQQSRIPMAALQMSSAYSMQSPPDLVDSFNSSSSPTASVTYYDLPDSEGTLNEMSDMFLDTFGSDLNNLEQETDLLNLMDNGKDFMCSDLTVDPFVMNMNMNNADVDALFAGADSSAWGQ